ncbi:hypothetical protein [Micromonospora sonneratiae]|uniref:Trm112 family protein n=1 Tax=Micromonospora sonneratiae TaxID=1184706 RepID=A0ABW3YFK8_9ACTN
MAAETELNPVRSGWPAKSDRTGLDCRPAELLVYLLECPICRIAEPVGQLVVMRR